MSIILPGLEPKKPVVLPGIKQSVRLIHGDCVNEMKKMSKGSVDLTITSPPYDNLRDYDNTLSWDQNTWMTIIQSLFHITKDGGVVVWIVGDATMNGSETGTSFKQALHAIHVGFKLHDTMIYMKDNPPPTGGSNRYYQSFEYMFVFSKGKPKVFNPIKTARRNKWNDKRTRRIRPVTRNKKGDFIKKQIPINTGDVKLQNVWSYVVSGGSVCHDDLGHRHPAIFPESLVIDHILSWSNKNQTVFDPMMGSGTVGKIALNLGRKFIGVEKNIDYFNIAKQRVHL